MRLRSERCVVGGRLKMGSEGRKGFYRVCCRKTYFSTKCNESIQFKFVFMSVRVHFRVYVRPVHLIDWKALNNNLSDRWYSSQDHLRITSHLVTSSASNNHWKFQILTCWSKYVDFSSNYLAYPKIFDEFL